jgi:hypothetical protein
MVEVSEVDVFNLLAKVKKLIESIKKDPNNFLKDCLKFLEKEYE